MNLAPVAQASVMKSLVLQYCILSANQCDHCSLLFCSSFLTLESHEEENFSRPICTEVTDNFFQYTYGHVGLVF